MSNSFTGRILPGIFRYPHDSKDSGGEGGYPPNFRPLHRSGGSEKTMSLENVPRCHHVKVNGTQCGSPALRRRRFCFFHDRIRREQAKIAAQASAQPAFDLPLLEDANSVQMALMKVIQMLMSGRMDHKTAGLILYALQTASVNLRNADFEVDEVSDVVIDPDTVNDTCINGAQWFEEDFDDEAAAQAEAEAQAQEKADGEDARPQTEAPAPKKPPASAKLPPAQQIACAES
jgi:hypothetical protein